jgi:L-ascorbate metabolism protein UlaG (beta-lactamase superfamily)
MLPVFGSLPDDRQSKEFEKSPQFNSQTKTFQNRNAKLVEKMRKEAMNFGTVIEWLKAGKNRTPHQPLPEVKPDLADFVRPSEFLKVIWFGHSSLLLNFAGKIILIDPVFSPSAGPFSFMVKRFQQPVLSRDELPEIDYIIISHDHYDHLDMDTVRFFKDKRAKFLAPLGVGSHLNAWGIESARITELDWWSGISFEGIEFIATPAQHFSGRTLASQNRTLWASWVIKGHGLSIFFSGDSGYDIHFKNIGDLYGPFDIAFIENGQYNVKWQAVHALPEQSVQAYFDLKAKKYFPIHWGMFVLSMHTWREPVDRLLQLARERGVNLVTPKIGEISVISPNYKNLEWWIDLE